MAEWFRYDVGLLTHPKFALVPERQRDKARLLYLQLIGFCAQFETDGWVPGTQLRELAEAVGVLRAGVTVDHLVEAGLVHRVDVPGELEVICRTCGEKTSSLQLRRNFATNSPRAKKQVRRDRRLDENVFFYVHDYLDKQRSHEWWETKRVQDKRRQRARRGGPVDLTLDDELSRRDVPYPGEAVSQRDAGHGAVTSRSQQDQTDSSSSLRTRSTHRDAAPEPAEPNVRTSELAAAGRATPPTTDATQAPPIEHVIAAVKSLRHADPGTAAVVLPLALGVSLTDFDDALAQARAGRNDAGLLVSLLTRRANQPRPAPGTQPGPEPDHDAARRAARLEQIAEDPDEHITAYAASLARLPHDQAIAHIDRLLDELPIDDTQRAGLRQLAVRAHSAA